MSLTIDGVWKAGVWATTVWANNVWREGAYIPVFDETLLSVGNGFKKYPEPKKRIKLVRKLSKELATLEQQINEVKAEPRKEPLKQDKKLAELVTYEKLLYEELVKEYDEVVKKTITAIEKNKTDQILARIKKDIEEEKFRKIEEMDIVFVSMMLAASIDS